MTNNTHRMEYYYENEAEQFVFYRVPKMLFKDKRFSKISSDAKLLYALFLDRMSLSNKNGWVDGEKRVYIYFSIQEIMDEFNIATEKCTKIMAELDDVKGCGLIHKKKQGQGKPAKIYVMKYTSVINENDTDENEGKVENNEEMKITSGTKENDENIMNFIVEGTEEEPRIITFSNSNVNHQETENSDFRKSKNKTFENRKSKLSEFENQDFRLSKSNYNKYNNTENNDNDYSDINPILSNQKNKRKGFRKAIKERRQYEELIKKNIEYDILTQNNPGVDIKGIVEIMLAAVCSDKEYLTINRNEIPQKVVKSRMLELDSGHIEYVLDCLNKNTSKIKNIRSYILTALYNSYVTMDHYYRAEVNYDMYG